MIEISDFGRRRKPYLVPLIIIPLLAGAGGAAWAAAEPQTYSYSVDIQVPAPGAQAGAAALEQNTGTYIGLVTSDPVAADVAKRTGVPSGDVSAGLTASRPGTAAAQSGLVTVTYTGTRRAQAKEIAEDAAVSAAGLLMRPAIDAATTASTGAAHDFDSAKQALLDMVKKYNGQLPTDSYRAIYNQISALAPERDAPGSGGRSHNDVVAAINKRKDWLKGLGPAVVEAQTLTARLDETNRAAVRAAADQRAVQARLDSAGASLTPSSASPEEVGKAALALRTAALAAGVGLLLAVALVTVAELLRTRRTASSPVLPPSHPDAPVSPAQTQPYV